MKTRIAIAAALVVVALGSAGCVREPLPQGWRVDLGNEISESTNGAATSGGDAITSRATFEPDGAKEASIELRMGAGEMIVRSGESSALAEASFEYGTPEMKPQTNYDVSGSAGTLTISQPVIRYKFGQSYPNSWDVRLAKAMPYELLVQMGAGSSDLDLSELDVRLLTMRLGAGETTVDLTGPRTEDVKGDIQAGVGQLTIILPRDVGVKVTGRNEGIGSFEAEGFKVQGDAYVNDVYGTTPATIELSVMRGVGEVKLELR